MLDPAGMSVSTQVVVALIALVGTWGAALITTRAKGWTFSGRSKQDKTLLGEWDCVWDINTPAKQPSINDIVTIQRVAGEQIRAIAQTPAIGKYRLAGRVSQSSLVTFFYEGLADRSPLGGVVILELNAVRDEMHGYWYEYGPKRVIIGGKTRWKKRSSSTEDGG